MIYHLSLFLKQYYSFFNVFHYTSVRSILGLLFAFSTSLLLGKYFINKLANLFRSNTREYTPESHKLKNQTPTMGGLFILFTVIISTLIFCNAFDTKIWLILACLALFGIIGFVDDYNKINKKKGVSARFKFCAQFLCAALIAGLWIYLCAPSLTVNIPMLKNVSFNFGALFMLWAIFVIVATSNAVNITDGLDGLATTSLIYNFATFAVVAYLSGNFITSIYLHMDFLGSAEITIVCSILVGALLGFLWYNSYPAEIFMGDVGSLSLGAALGLIALMCKQELLLLVCGGLFVLETASVIIQVFSYRCFKKRVFKMAPIHHHFELLGWPESKITIRLAIISFILCLLALVMLKVR